MNVLVIGASSCNLRLDENLKKTLNMIALDRGQELTRFHKKINEVEKYGGILYIWF